MVVTWSLHVTTNQALAHFHAIRAVRTITRVHVWGRTPEHASRLVATIKQLGGGMPVDAFPSARDAVVEADIVCTLTPSTAPILEGKWLRAGAYVTSI